MALTPFADVSTLPMRMTSQVIGRAEPLAQLDRFVQELAGGARCLVVEGEAGIGKTTLWQWAVDAAAREGYSVLISRPAESEAGLAYSGLADLLADVDMSVLEVLPQPQRRALDVALLRAEPIGRAPEPRAVFAGFGTVLKALGGQAPVLVAVDDLHWLDASSLRAIEFVSRRLGDETIGVLATTRVDSGQSGLPGAPTLRLGPLTPAALHRLVKSHVGVNLTRPAVLRLHRATGGNPFFAVELAGVLVTAGLPDASEPWPVPTDLRDTIQARIGRLPDTVRSVLLTAAASARPTVDGLDVAALENAAEAGIVTVGQHGRVSFAHPLYASAIYASATPDERRRVHAVLADEAIDVEERARHQALACTGSSEEVAGLLDEAALRARARGAPDVAAELEERSWALTPLDLPERAWHRRAMAADYHFHAGDLESARGLLVQLVDGPVLGPPQSRTLRLLGEVCYRLGALDDALRHLRRAVDAAEGDPDSVAAAEIDVAFVLFNSFGSFEEGARAARRALAAAEAVGDDGLLSSALAASVLGEFILGEGLDEEKLARSLRLENPDRSIPIERRPSLLGGFAWLEAGQFDRARAVLEALAADLTERGEESDLPYLLAGLARLECSAGNLDAAGALADHGYDLATQAGSESLASFTRATRALVYAHEGREAETRLSVAEAVELATRSGWRLAAFWATSALGSLELSLGNYEAVLATLADSLDLVEEVGVVEPSRHPFLPDAIEALAHLGQLERAETLLASFDERGEALDRVWARATGARCRGLLLAARGDLDGALSQLEEAIEQHNRTAMPLERSRTLLAKGELHRRRKEKLRAVNALDEALAGFEEHGARLWATKARNELGRVGLQRGSRWELTAREEQIAHLAASGLRNREIADRLFLSPKTIEANLARIYRKLEIHSRAELGARMFERQRAGAPQT